MLLQRLASSNYNDLLRIDPLIVISMTMYPRWIFAFWFLLHFSILFTMLSVNELVLTPSLFFEINDTEFLKTYFPLQGFKCCGLF